MKFEVVLISILISMCVLAVVILIKNGITYHNFDKIQCAVHKYNIDEIDDAFIDNRLPDLIPYSCFKSYEMVLFDLFDWGDKHIIPKEYYKRIKPYL